MLILIENKDKIKEIMSKQGWELIHESQEVLNFSSQKIELGKEIFGGKFKIKVLKIEDQIGLKVQASSNDPQRMHQDMADIELLIRNNYPKLDIELLKEYFALFEREEELNRILKETMHAK